MAHIDTFHLTSLDGETIKFTIHDEIIGNNRCYYAKYVNTDLPLYKKMNEWEQSTAFGIDYSDKNGHKVFYKDKDKMINDLKTFWQVKKLESDM